MNTNFERLDNRKIKQRKGEILLFASARNEGKILPAFYDHYRRIGVNRFFIVDNESSDSTQEFLMNQKDTHVFYTNECYAFKDPKSNKHQNNNRWLNQLMYTYAIEGQWLFFLDVDEFFYFPNCETDSIFDLMNFAEKIGATCVQSKLVDMYSKCPIKDAHYRAGQNPLEVLSYFDKPPLNRYENPRNRLLGSKHTLRLRKFSFFKFKEGVFASRGHHDLKNGVNKWKEIMTVLLHFKFTSDYFNHVKDASERKVYHGGSKVKRRMYACLQKNPDATFYDKDISVKFQDTSQLVDHGLMWKREIATDFS